MYLLCINCGEPWVIDYVTLEEPGAFKRKGGVIYQCPSCTKCKPKLDKNREPELHAVAVIGDVMGEDVDGLSTIIHNSGFIKSWVKQNQNQN